MVTDWNELERTRLSVEYVDPGERRAEMRNSDFAGKGDVAPSQVERFRCS